MDKIAILDHGYIQLIEKWGSEEGIVEAARMSTGKGFLGWGPIHPLSCPLAGHNYSVKSTIGLTCSGYLVSGTHNCVPISGDEKLLKYLYEHKHSTPFEMAGLIIEVQAPIFVFREWHRHRTQSYNELSSRYTPLPDVNYVPTIERLMMNAGTGNKQAGTIKGSQELTEGLAAVNIRLLKKRYEDLENDYQAMLACGIPKELARIILPVGRYSRMRANANLRNWLQFLTLRMDNAAQYEIRQYANALGDIIAKEFPRTWELFNSERNN